MAQNTQVKSDRFGLYVIAGGYISRPFHGTIFKEGDLVKTHHFGGSVDAGVTFREKDLKFNTRGDYEIWTTTGSATKSDPNTPKFEETYLSYKKFSNMNPFAKDINLKFKDRFKSKLS